ncbi:MAG TPA: alanine--glyoxylate aminotransferase family protein, partial [Bryobacteraceae bacterium]|nr:alanine--glyoxylate aminotransferase family protein [Bryobacteraceae bacterium]
NDKVIVCSAGKFGERWVEITKAYGLQPVVLSADYGQVVSAQQVADALAENPDVRGVFVQASETSTGAQHDVEGMAAAIRKTEALFIVDAITGLGTMPLDIDGWGLDVVVGGSQKSFMIPPGIAFMAVSAKAWGGADSSDLPKYYFNLKKERKNAAAGESSWTPNTSHLLALAEALKYIKSIGMDKLIENAQMLALATRKAAEALGLELFAAAAPSGCVTAIRPPRGMDSSVIVKEFRNRFGSVIANGQGSMKGQIFRIAHLGYFDFSDLFAMVAQLEIILAANGADVQFGAGVAAVQQVYAQSAGVRVREAAAV